MRTPAPTTDSAPADRTHTVLSPSGYLRPSPDDEWILPIGNGGFAMGTASGVARRKYHALMNASAHPPVDRVSCLTGLDEIVILLDAQGAERDRWTLGMIRRPDGAVVSADGSNAPFGPSRFEKSATRCRWIYERGGVELVKELVMGWRRNACAVRYTLRGHAGAARILVLPRVTLRDFHGLVEKPGLDRWKVRAAGSVLEVEGESRALRLRIDHGVAIARPLLAPTTLLDFERERHQGDTETALVPGWFEADAHAGEALVFTVAAALAPDEPDLTLPDRDERGQHLATVRARFVEGRPQLAGLTPLVDAADDYLVPRVVAGTTLTTVLAGFPWFADWGRDTMISMVGLMIATRRLDEARGCLKTFAAYVDQGMIPNLFDDYGGPPQYNTVDASLWFLHACGEYLAASGDQAALRSELLPACHEIVRAHRAGTRFGIRMDPADGLIQAGDETTQLTWMDAKRDGVVFTPRHGKAVEINALWHHGLLRLAKASEACGFAAPAGQSPAELRELAARVSVSFRAAFWFEREQRLHDCLQADGRGGWKPVPQVRPNQIFAVSLEHSPLELAQRRAVVENVRRHHVTPFGLRTLASGDPGYRGRFEGDMMSRDGAYHNGTVWPWLIGPFCEAVLRVGEFSDASRAEVRRLLEPLIGTTRPGGGGGCLGQIAEVFDGDEPRRAQGCVAQAWSIAETLRLAVLASPGA